MQLTSLLTTLLASTASAHFVLNYPPTVGPFNDGAQKTAPCGGYTPPYFNSSSNVTAGQFAVSMLSTHPQAQFLIRVSLNETEPYTWTNVVPVISQQGLGNMCFNNLLKAPAGFEGKTALLQVIQTAADGALYQCAAVNFVAGSNTTAGPTCVNATGITATVTNLNSLNGTTSTNSSGAAGSASASASGSAASSTATARSGADVAAHVGTIGFVGSLLAAVALL